MDNLNEKIYNLYQNLDSNKDKSTIWSILDPETRQYIDHRNMDINNEFKLKSIEFKAFGDYESLWGLRRFRGILDDSPYHYSILNRLSCMVMDISNRLEEDGYIESRKKLEELSYIIEFLMGDV